MFSFDCFLSDGSDDSNEKVYYEKIIIMAFIPFLFAIGSAIFWIIFSIYKSDYSYLKNQFVATITILFFLIHPFITKSAFSVYNCMYIEDEGYYLVNDLEIECFDDTHTFYIIVLATPTVITWVLGVPAVVLFFLSKRKNNLDSLNNRIKFGFIFNGFHKRTFYWEFLILYRKIIIISISVFL